MCEIHKEYYGVEFCGDEAENLMEAHRIIAGRTKDQEHLRRLKLVEEARKFDLGLTQIWIKQVSRKIEESK